MGFSLRALGSVTPINNILEVQQPISAITFDVVSNPSHKNARIMEFIPEHDGSLLTENNNGVLLEGSEEDLRLLYESDGISINNSIFSLDQFLKDVIQENFFEVINNVKFNI